MVREETFSKPLIFSTMLVSHTEVNADADLMVTDLAREETC